MTLEEKARAWLNTTYVAQGQKYVDSLASLLREVAEEAKREEREALRAKLEQHRLAGLTPYLLSWLDARGGKP